MIIRECLESDIIPTGEFYDGIVKWLDGHVNYPLWIYKVYPSLLSVDEMAKEESQYICIYDDRIVGAFALNDKPQGAYWKGQWGNNLDNGSYLVLHALAIPPECQRKGIAAKILDFCIDKAKSEGYEAIRLDVIPENYPAKGFLKRMDLNMPAMWIWNWI